MRSVAAEIQQHIRLTVLPFLAKTFLWERATRNTWDPLIRAKFVWQLKAEIDGVGEGRQSSPVAEPGVRNGSGADALSPTPSTPVFRDVYDEPARRLNGKLSDTWGESIIARKVSFPVCAYILGSVRRSAEQALEAL